MQLWPYQNDLIAEFDRKLAAGIRRIIIVAPTGAGKTVIASEIVKRAGLRRVLFIAHHDELLTQARDKLRSFGIGAGIIKAGRDKDARPQALVQVAGVQTLYWRCIRTDRMELPAADYLFVDEAHHIRAMTYQRIVDAYPDAIKIGLTATPCRGDGRGLGNMFDAMLECPQIGELQKLGNVLVEKLKIFAPPPPDLSSVRVMATGDYDVDQLSAAMDPLVGDVIEHWLKHADRRRSIVFAVDVKHSVHLTDELIKSGVKAEHLDGNTPQDERDAILERLRSGKTEVVSNCMVLTEGFDLPDIGAIVLARPTRSLGLFRQMIGRGLRAAEGKSDVVILDHSGGVHRHGRPDDPIEWTLDTDRRTTNPTHEARVAKAGSDPFVECKACGHLRMKGMACEACGWEPKPPARPQEYLDVDLVELGQPAIVRSDSERRIFYAELRGFQQNARKRDGSPYANGWAANQYRTKHGSFPPWSWNNDTPITPSDATRRWIKSRMIAWARARAG